MKNGLVLEREKRNVRACQFFPDRLVARFCRRLIVAIGEYGVHAAFAREFGNFMQWHAMTHDQAAAGFAQ